MKLVEKSDAFRSSAAQYLHAKADTKYWLARLLPWNVVYQIKKNIAVVERLHFTFLHFNCLLISGVIIVFLFLTHKSKAREKGIYLLCKKVLGKEFVALFKNPCFKIIDCIEWILKKCNTLFKLNKFNLFEVFSS